MYACSEQLDSSCVGNMSPVSRTEAKHRIIFWQSQGTAVPIVITTVWTQTLAVAIVCVRVSPLPSSIL